MIDKIKKILNDLASEDKQVVKISEEDLIEQLIGSMPTQKEPDLRIIGLFSDVAEEKVAELAHALLYLNELNKLEKEQENKKPIQFYLSTYGGNADDMFALYDIMKMIQQNCEIHTFGVGKVMSAGVLLLAAGTKGQRKIGKNCRVMIHSVIGGNHGSIHSLENEMEEIRNSQETYMEALVKETSLTKRTLKKLLERKVNVYLSATEAIEYGIADIIV